MNNEEQEFQPCDACGVSAEVGFIIKEGDDVAEVSIFAHSKAALENEFNNYLALAKEVNANFEYQTSELTEEKSAFQHCIQILCVLKS